MRIFLKKALYSVGIFVILFLLLVFITGSLTGGSRLNGIDVKEARASQIKGQRKLLVVGGSSSDYGINSELIETAVGVPVVNLGLQGSLGLAFMLNQASAISEEGDIMLLHLESELFSKIPVRGESTLVQLISRSPGAMRYVEGADYGKMPLYLCETFRSNITAALLSVAYKVTGRKSNTDLRNLQGDYVGHKGKQAIYLSEKVERCEGAVNPDAVRLLSQFVKDCSSRDITVLFAFAPIDKESITDGCSLFFEGDIRKIKDLAIIGSYDEAKFSPDNFFDTSHHLKFEMRDTWTAFLIKRIKSAV